MPSRVQAAPLRPAQPSNMALWGQFTYGRGAPRGLPGASGGGGCPIGRVPHQGATHALVGSSCVPLKALYISVVNSSYSKGAGRPQLAFGAGGGGAAAGAGAGNRPSSG